MAPPLSEPFESKLILLELRMKIFNDGKTWEGAVHATFKDAAKATGLYDDGIEYQKSLEEAV